MHDVESAAHLRRCKVEFKPKTQDIVKTFLAHVESSASLLYLAGGLNTTIFELRSACRSTARIACSLKSLVVEKAL